MWHCVVSVRDGTQPPGVNWTRVRLQSQYEAVSVCWAGVCDVGGFSSRIGHGKWRGTFVGAYIYVFNLNF